MKYTKTELKSAVNIDGIYTVHYFEYIKDFAYPGESHNFWELVYADRKSLVLTSEKTQINLKAGQLFIHKPNEFHSIRCESDSTANSVIISFDCELAQLFAIAGKPISLSADEKRIIANIINESIKTFKTPLGEPSTAVMEKAANIEFGAEQLIKNYIEQLIISLVRGKSKAGPEHVRENNKLLYDICAWLKANTDKQLHFGDVLTQFNTSASVVKKIFHDYMNCGVMEYFMRLKIEDAKELIRRNEYNFTEIASLLSFNTSQYFTTVFKRVSGMTPTEYEFSIKSHF